MFNNANVLFRIQNVNGSSQATRIDNRGPGKNKRLQIEADKEKRPAKRTKSVQVWPTATDTPAPQLPDSA